MNPSSTTWHTLPDAARIAGICVRTARARVVNLPADLARHVRHADDPRVGTRGGWIVAPEAVDLLRDASNGNGTSNGIRPSLASRLVTTPTSPATRPEPAEVGTVETPLGILSVATLPWHDNPLVRVALLVEGRAVDAWFPAPSRYRRILVASNARDEFAILVRQVATDASGTSVVSRNPGEWTICEGDRPRIGVLASIDRRNGGIFSSAAELSCGRLRPARNPNSGAFIVARAPVFAALADLLASLVSTGGDRLKRRERTPVDLDPTGRLG